MFKVQSFEFERSEIPMPKAYLLRDVVWSS
jgi:hypothetical protein